MPPAFTDYAQRICVTCWVGRCRECVARFCDRWCECICEWLTEGDDE